MLSEVYRGGSMGHFVEPRSEEPVVIYRDGTIRIVKVRTQMHTGEWNKELIIEINAGTDAMGNDRWLELSGLPLDKYLRRKNLHQIDWASIGTIARTVAEEEKKPDYDYIFYINRGRYRVKGEPPADGKEVS
jgi:hypothetical protein